MYLKIYPRFYVTNYIGCPTTYQTRHFFNNSKTNEVNSTKQTHTTDTFLFIFHTTNVLPFKYRCNSFIGFRFIKEMPGLVGSGTPCITLLYSLHILIRIFLIGFPSSLRSTASHAVQKETLTSGFSFFVLEAFHSISWQLEWAHFPVRNL